ncbi:MAG TPA: lysoplasmalogenase [Xanthomonadaceae bacterium]
MSSRLLTVVLFVAVLAAIAGAMLGGSALWLHYIGKPLATLLLCWQVVRTSQPVSPRYRHAVAIGMVLSLVGDVCLMLPGDLFVPGLVAFLLAHIGYIVAFAPGSAAKARVPAFALVALIGAANLYGLLPRVAPDLKIPVVAYTVVLAAMAAFALARAWTPTVSSLLPRSARWAAIGAVLFMASDSLLAWDRFGGGIPMSALLVLGTYYAAQWCIARSVERR